MDELRKFEVEVMKKEFTKNQPIHTAGCDHKEMVLEYEDENHAWAWCPTCGGIWT